MLGWKNEGSRKEELLTPSPFPLPTPVTLHLQTPAVSVTPCFPNKHYPDAHPLLLAPSEFRYDLQNKERSRTLLY